MGPEPYITEREHWLGQVQAEGKGGLLRKCLALPISEVRDAVSHRVRGNGPRITVGLSHASSGRPATI